MDIEQFGQKVTKDLAVIMEGETSGAFRNKKWDGKKWKPGHRAGNLLIKSGALRRSTFFRALNGRVQVSNYLHYAAIHQNGGVVRITQRARNFFFYMYKKTGDKMWLAMAITKKKYIKIPARPYLGVTADTTKSLNEQVKKRLQQLGIDAEIGVRINR